MWRGLGLGGGCGAVVLHVSLVLKAMGGYSLKASLQHKKGKNVTKGHGPDALLTGSRVVEAED